MNADAVAAFRTEALEANRAGRLTDAQASEIRARASSTRKELLVLAAGFAVIGIVVLTAAGPTSGAAVRLIGGIGGLVIGAVLALAGLPIASALTRDLRTPRVEAIEGAVLRNERIVHATGSSLPTFSITVAHRRYKVDRALFDATPNAGHVRIYVLPRSHTVVNLERLADRPLTDAAIGSPQTPSGHRARGAIRRHGPRGRGARRVDRPQPRAQA